MNIEKLLPMALGNKILMKFITRKAESLVRSKMEGATHVQIEIQGGQTIIKAAIFEGVNVEVKRAWLIDTKKFLSTRSGIDIMKIISFIKIGGKPVDFSVMPDMNILIHDGGEGEMFISASAPDGNIVTSGTIPELLRLAAANLGKIEIDEAATLDFEAGEYEGENQELPENVEGEYGYENDGEPDYEADEENESEADGSKESE